MKLWKALVILFCVLLGSGVSHAGFLSSDPGLSPGQILPPGLIIPNPIISNPQLSGLITLVPGSTLWVQGNVQYEPYATIVGPDGSIWNYNGLNNLANLNIAAGGSITFNGVPMGGACPANTYMVALSPTVIPTCAAITNIPGPVTINNPTFTGTVTGPDGSTWNINGINNLKSLNIAAGGALTFNGVPMGGNCPANQFVNAMSPTGLLTCAIPAGGGGGVIISSTAPVGPALGQLWFDTVGVQTYIYYNDGTSSQWVPVINGGGGSSGGTLPTATGPYLTLQTNAVNSVVWNNSVGIGVAPSAGNGNLTMMADTDVTTTPATANFPDTGTWNDKGLTVYGGADFFAQVNGGFPPQIWIDGVSGGLINVATPKFGGAVQQLTSGGGVGSPELSSNFWSAEQGDAIVVAFAVQSPTPALTLVSQTNVPHPYSWTCGAQFGSSGNVVGMCWAFNVDAGGAHFLTSGLTSKGLTYQVYRLPRVTAIDVRGTQVCPSSGSACQVTSTTSAANAREIGMVIYSTPTTNSSATPVTSWSSTGITTNASVPSLNIHGLASLSITAGSPVTGGWTNYNAVAGNALLMTFQYPVSPNANDEQWDVSGLSFIPSIGLGANTSAWSQTPGGVIMDSTLRYYQPGYTGSTPNNCYWDNTGLHNCTGSFAPLVNPAGGQNNYAPLASPTFSGTVTMPGGGTFTTAGYNNAAGIGIGQAAVAGTLAVTNNQNGNTTVFQGLNSSTGTSAQVSANFNNGTHGTSFGLVGTGYTASGTLIPGDSFYVYNSGANGMEFVNAPASGTAPINFWVNATTLAGTFSSAGLSNVKALGIGTAAGTLAGNPALLGVYANTTGVAPSVAIWNENTTDTQASAQYTIYTGTGGSIYPTSLVGFGAAYTGNVTFPANSAALMTSEPNGLKVGTNTLPNKVTFSFGGVDTVVVNQNGLVVPLTTSTGLSTLMFGPTSSTSLGAITIGGNNAVWSIGGYSSSNTWIATNATAVMENLTQAAFSGAGGIAWYLNQGLTVGSTYTPNVVMQLGPTGNANTTLTITNPNAGTSAGAGVFVNSATYQAGMQIMGTGNTSNAATPANTTVFSGNGSDVDIIAYNNAPTIGIKFWAGGQFLGKFRTAGDNFTGLELGGYASRIGAGGNGQSSLSIGNIYLEGTSFATGGISGSVLFNGTNWVSDGGTGGGGALLQLAGTCIAMYNVGSTTGGAVVAWTQIGSWCGSGMATDHLSNLTSFRLPTVSSGALTQDSRDMFGWVTNVTGGQTTITFAEPFLTESNCSLTASGAPYLWFNANQSASQDTFVCAVPWTGEPCPDGATVEYHCFGQAGEQVKAP